MCLFRTLFIVFLGLALLLGGCGSEHSSLPADHVSTLISPTEQTNPAVFTMLDFKRKELVFETRPGTPVPQYQVTGPTELVTRLQKLAEGEWILTEVTLATDEAENTLNLLMEKNAEVKVLAFDKQKDKNAWFITGPKSNVESLVRQITRVNGPR